MKEINVATRYAKSIYELAEAAGSVETIQKELAVIGEAILKKPELGRFFENPLVRASEKKAPLSNFNSHLSDLAKQFIFVLIDKKRMNLFATILTQLNTIIHKHKGLQEATIVSARPLEKDTVTKIQNFLAARTGKKVVCLLETNKTLLGGIQIRLGNRLIDGSLKTKFQELASYIRTAKVA